MKKSRMRILNILLVTLALLLGGCGNTANLGNEALQSTKSPVLESTTSPTKAPGKVSGKLTVHFVDVGQGDCILLVSDNQTMLIDAGNNKDGSEVVKYIKSQGIEKLDYVIGTHPDADHIGGLDNVINAFDIGKVYMPKKQHNTKTFEDVLVAIKNKGLKVTSPKVGDTLTLGNAVVTFLGPVSSYEDNNNNSIVVKVEHGENSFLMTGDASLDAEVDLLKNKEALQADVLKVGHHGSHSSTSKKFLEAVKPTYAVISCGVDNSYGHPHKETMNYLNDAGIIIYRTDQDQTICMISDGNELTIKKNLPSAIGESSNPSSDNTSNKDDTDKNNTDKNNTSNNTSSNVLYIGNKNTKKFHELDCSSIPEEANQVSFHNREEAIEKGYDPCKRCNP